jgi:hypothetical protein
MKSCIDIGSPGLLFPQAIASHRIAHPILYAWLSSPKAPVLRAALRKQREPEAFTCLLAGRFDRAEKVPVVWSVPEAGDIRAR